ncbi:unnamed protein product [Staurois parvus]|uniref:Secreted protein n=1 Tax=Staurois parvus TaxID=386267 RepID=A0ABN9GCH0_9NEOB|nr:unnamed protein product [Staurois parvus]
MARHLLGPVMNTVSWSSTVLSAVSWSSLYCLQSLVIPCTACSLWSSPVLPAVSGHPCTVCSLWSSLYCLQS